MVPKKENKFFIFDNMQERNLKYLLKSFFYKILKVKYKIKRNKPQFKDNQKKYNVSICAIFKNEAPYLKEWIEYHKLVGIDHFYMYNNNSDDEFREVLEPYLKSETVTLIEWPYNQAQIESYKDCISCFNNESKWIGFIDIDEFVVPKSTDDIYSFLIPFEKNRGSVLIYWKLFGTSGLINRNMNNLVIEDFTVCWSKYCDIGKCFYNTSFGYNENSIRNKGLHHRFWASSKGKDIPPVNIYDEVCVGNQNTVKTNDFPIQINHYFTKSYGEYIIKKNKGDVYFIDNPHDEEYFYEHEMKCGSADYSIYKYLIKLKLLMRGER